MTRSYAVTDRKLAPRVARKSERNWSITKLGFACFRLIPIDDHEAGEPAHAWIRVRETRNAMMSLVRGGPSKRETFMRRIDTLDRVLQASLRTLVVR
jgi:hypothetical protein